jgi:hypothetical protein
MTEREFPLAFPARKKGERDDKSEKENTDKETGTKGGTSIGSEPAAHQLP